MGLLLYAAPAAAQDEMLTTKILLGNGPATITNPSGSDVSIGSGTFTAGTFNGSCASCTAIPAGNLTGTIANGVQDNITRLGAIGTGGAWGKDLLPDAADTRSIGSATLPWLSATVSQMNATLFAKSTQTLYGGWLAVSKNAGTFAAAVASGNTTIDFGQSMTANQFVLVRAADTGGTITEEYLKVGTNVSGTVYNVTRNLSGVGAKNWAIGTPYQVRGVSGDGWLELDAFDTPRLSIWSQGSAYNNSTEQIRIGYLTGMPNSSSGLGAYMGSSSNYFRWDGTNLTLKSADLTIDNTGVQFTAQPAGFAANDSIRFQSYYNPGLTTPAAGSVFALYSQSNFLSSDELVLESTAHPSTTADDRAMVTLRAQGWRGGGTNAAVTNPGTIQIDSQYVANQSIITMMADSILVKNPSGGATTLTITPSTGAFVGSGAGTVKGSFTIATGTDARVFIGDTSGTNTSAFEELRTGSTKFAWLIGAQFNINGFEITPSTAAGGSTFSSPAFKIDTSSIPYFPAIPSITGTRYLCIDSSGAISSSATGCSGS